MLVRELFLALTKACRWGSESAVAGFASVGNASHTALASGDGQVSREALLHLRIRGV